RGRGGASAMLDQVEIRDVKFNLEKLGAGDALDGRPTQRYKITSTYHIVWAGQGVDARAVSEIWTTPLAVRIPNPFEPLGTAEPLPDSPLIEYSLMLPYVRRQMDGVPIKVTTTTTFNGIENVVGFPGVGRGRGAPAGGGGNEEDPTP